MMPSVKAQRREPAADDVRFVPGPAGSLGLAAAPCSLGDLRMTANTSGFFAPAMTFHPSLRVLSPLGAC